MFSRLFRHVLTAQILEYPLWTVQEAVFNCRHSCSRRRFRATRAYTPADEKRRCRPSQLPASGRQLPVSSVPVVSHAVALFEPVIRPSAVQMLLHLPAGVLNCIRPRGPARRRTWQRFVAIRISSSDAQAMDPLVLPEAIALVDRHYNSLAPYRPNRANLYAVRHGSHLVLRYVDFRSSRLVLRPHNLVFPVDLLEIEDDQSPGDLLAGRIALILNEV